MQRLFGTLLFWTLILSACTTGVSSPQAVSSSTAEATLGPPITATPKLVTTSTPRIDLEDFESTAISLNSENCGYQWVYDEDLPELANNFEHSIQALQPQAQAYVYAFGERCVLTDGSADFIIMETDFDITIPVSNVYKEAALGGWIKKVMQVIENIATKHILGQRPGRVTIVFRSGDDEQRVAFFIDDYEKLRPDLSDLEIFTALAAP